MGTGKRELEKSGVGICCVRACPHASGLRTVGEGHCRRGSEMGASTVSCETFVSSHMTGNIVAVALENTRYLQNMTGSSRSQFLMTGMDELVR